MRQPLARAVIVATEPERRTIEGLAEIVRAELNVRELEFVSEEAELASWTVKPEFSRLGPRFGKEMPRVKAAVEALDADNVRATIDAGGQVGISIDGREHTLGPDELSFAMEPLEGYRVESEAGRAVAVALELDADLIRALIEQGMAEEEIAQHLGIDLDTVYRYKQVTGIAALFARAEYSLAWEMQEVD